MNRHGYHNEHEYDEDAEEGNLEMPLPTYEEVVGAAANNIGFKEDLLVPPGTSCHGSRAGSSAELPRPCHEVVIPEDLRRPESRRKGCAKSYFWGLTFIIFIPLLILFIVLQLKSCHSCEHPMEKDNTIDQINEMNLAQLEQCSADLEKTERRYNGAFSELQSVKRERDDLLTKQQTADTALKKLRYDYNTVYTEKTHLQAEIYALKKDLEKYKESEKLLSSNKQDS